MRRLQPPKLRHRPQLVLSALTLTLAAAPAPASTPCDSALHRPPTFREVQGALAPGQHLCYAAELPAAGLWLVDVSAAPGEARSSTPPRLTAVGRLCDRPADGSGAAAQVLHRLTGGAVVRVGRSGRYLFCVAGRDPGEALARHRVTSLFAAPHLKGDPDEDEPDPDPFLHVPGGEGLTGTYLPLLPGGLGTLLDALAPACRSLAAGDTPAGDGDPGDGGDDHGDFWGCATEVAPGRPVAGRLAGTGDLDVFRLRADGWGVHALAVRGAAATALTLVDARGYPLRRVEGGGEGGLRIVELLAPGEYFLEVEAGDDAGDYRLRVRRFALP